VVGSHFRPEFLNRIDEQVVFHPLLREQIAGIALLQLARVRERLQEQQLQLEVSDSALAHISEIGFDPVYGARPLKRAIQRVIENRLAVALLSGDYLPGDTIWVDGDEQGITITKKPA